MEKTIVTLHFFCSGGDLDETGFLGCMKNLQIQGEFLTELSADANNGVVNGSCGVQDRQDKFLISLLIAEWPTPTILPCSLQIQLHHVHFVV